MIKKNVAVFFGGKNDEHNVSLSSAEEVIKVIDKKKYNIIYVAILKNGNWIIKNKAKKYLKTKKDNFNNINEITKFIKMAISNKINFVFPILHGKYGEDGRLQGFLDILNIPYIFSKHSAHSIAIDKSLTKTIVKTSGVRVIPGFTIENGQKINETEIIKNLSLPLVVKPNNSGSSVGISLVFTKKDIKTAIKNAFKYDNQVIIEKMIKGRELTIGILEKNGKIELLPITEIIPKTSKWYDYNSKYKEGGSEHICPAVLSPKISKTIKEYALKSFQAIGGKDLARVDFILDNKNKIYFLEINTIPGMTKTSLVPESAKAAGLSFEDLIENLLDTFDKT